MPVTRNLRDAHAAPVQLPRELAMLPKPEPTKAGPKPGALISPIPETIDKTPGAIVQTNANVPAQPDTAHRALDDRLDRLEKSLQLAAGPNNSLGSRLPSTRVSLSDKRFYVLGQVRGPGSFDWLGNETVVDAIVQAGFPARMAAPNEIILVRPTDPCGGRIVLPICYDDIVQLGDTSTNYQILPGDRIIVPKKSLLQSIFPFANRKQCVCLKPHVGLPIPVVQCDPAPCGP